MSIPYVDIADEIFTASDRLCDQLFGLEQTRARGLHVGSVYPCSDPRAADFVIYDKDGRYVTESYATLDSLGVSTR